MGDESAMEGEGVEEGAESIDFGSRKDDADNGVSFDGLQESHLISAVKPGLKKRGRKPKVKGKGMRPQLEDMQMVREKDSLDCTAASTGPKKRGRKPKPRGMDDHVGPKRLAVEVIEEHLNFGCPVLDTERPGDGIVPDGLEKDHFTVVEAESAVQPSPKKRGRKPKLGVQYHQGWSERIAGMEEDPKLSAFTVDAGRFDLSTELVENLVQEHPDLVDAASSRGTFCYRVPLYYSDVDHWRVMEAENAAQHGPRKRGRKPKAKEIVLGEERPGSIPQRKEKYPNLADSASNGGNPDSRFFPGELSGNQFGQIGAETGTKPGPRRRGRPPKKRPVNINKEGAESIVVILEDKNPYLPKFASNRVEPNSIVSSGHLLENDAYARDAIELSPRKRGRKSNHVALADFSSNKVNHFQGIEVKNAFKFPPKRRGPKARGMSHGQGGSIVTETTTKQNPFFSDFASTSGNSGATNPSDSLLGNHCGEIDAENPTKPGPKKRGRKPKSREANCSQGLRAAEVEDTEADIITDREERRRNPDGKELKINQDGSTGLVTVEDVSLFLESYVDKCRVRFLLFDYSVENHFKAIETISSLCGMAKEEVLEADVVEHLLSTVIFLEQWKDFYYQPKPIRFSYQTGSTAEKVYVDGVTLPQFSSASIPKMESCSGSCGSFIPSKDFILHAGGPVWALDWCPRVHQVPYHRIKCEYLAVAAHPPESSYHKIGEPLTGRGLIQIWCIVNVDEEKLSTMEPVRSVKRTVRSESLNGSPSNLVEELSEVNELVGPVDGGILLGHDGLETKMKFGSSESARSRSTKKQARLKSQSGKSNEFPNGYMQANRTCGPDGSDSSQILETMGSWESSMLCYSLPEDVALPRLVLGMAHNGRITWDAKWKPLNEKDSEGKHRMGYLAVLLGNGSVEVWEIPFPHVIKTLYTSKCRESSDPRFVKLQPVFKCSKIHRGDHQSIPLTVEWSSASPYNLLLAGYHDGTVALWKFSARSVAPSADTRPLLCFSADNVPIRALAWGPAERDEGANLIVTGGHEGLRFWDLRDPYRPLWDLNLVRRAVLSMDWLDDPGCVLLVFDDGTLRILSLCQAANDSHLSGKPFRGSSQHGLHSYYSSAFTSWSLHLSRLTGLVAYCGVDGSARCFQLSRKAVEKDASRNRAPVFLCGSITEEDSVLTINTPLSTTPISLKKVSSESKRAPESALAKRMKPPLPDCDSVTANSEPSSQGAVVKKLDEEMQEDSKSAGQEVQIFPPKNVSLHRVRWNMNRGSERWLCYGGAAGLVRCQDISLQPAAAKR